MPIVFLAILGKNTSLKTAEVAFPSIQVSKCSGGACPQTPLVSRTFGAQLPSPLLL